MPYEEGGCHIRKVDRLEADVLALAVAVKPKYQMARAARLHRIISDVQTTVGRSLHKINIRGANHSRAQPTYGISDVQTTVGPSLHKINIRGANHSRAQPTEGQ